MTRVSEATATFRRLRAAARAVVAPSAAIAGDRLDIVLPPGWPTTSSPIAWYRRTHAGTFDQGSVGNLDELIDIARDTAVHVWTPAIDTVFMRTTLPTRSRSKIAQALPYALEDQLLEDPQRLHFAYTHEPDGGLAVAVTRRERVDAWRQALDAVGVRPASVSPVVLALPLAPNGWSAAFGPDGLWLRTGTAAGLNCAPSLRTPPAMIISAMRDARSAGHAPEQITVFAPPHGFDPDAWSQALELPVMARSASFWKDPGAATPALSLLYSKTDLAARMRAISGPLRPALVLILAWVVIGFGVNLWQWWQLRQAHNRNVAEMTQLVRRTFPEVKTVLDPAKQMQRGLEQLQARAGGGATGDLLLLLEHLATAFGPRANLTLESLKYGEHALVVELTAPDNAAVDSLKTKLGTHGLTTQVLASERRPGGAGVAARVRVQVSAGGAAPRDQS